MFQYFFFKENMTNKHQQSWLKNISKFSKLHIRNCIFLNNQLIVRQTIDNGSLALHVKKLQRVYRGRVEAMDDALHEHFSGIAEWTRPDGGYFFWVRFDESLDTTPLRDKARELETGFQCGAAFSTNGQLSNYLRLSFSHYNDPSS